MQIKDSDELVPVLNKKAKSSSEYVTLKMQGSNIRNHRKQNFNKIPLLAEFLNFS